MLKKTVTVLMILFMLLSVLAACGNIEPTAAPTSAPTVAPTEAESEYGSNTCTEPSAPSEEMTEVLTEEPTIEGTVAPTEEPTEACTHEWQIVPNEECTHCGETQPHTDKRGEKYVRYQLSGFCTVTRFSDDEVRECADRMLLDILNRQDWQVYHGYEFALWQKRAYSFTFAGNIRFYYNCAEGDNRGQIVNYVDGRWAQLSDEDATTLNHMLTALFPDSLSEQTINRIELVYCGHSERAYMIEDEEEIERLVNFLFEAKAKQVGESTCGFYGGGYSLDLYSEGKNIFAFNLYDESMYSTWMHKDVNGYPYFYYADLSEMYNYLAEHYPHEFWFPES